MLALYEPIGALYFQGSASTGYSGLRKAYKAMLADVLESGDLDLSDGAMASLRLGTGPARS